MELKNINLQEGTMSLCFKEIDYSEDFPLYYFEIDKFVEKENVKDRAVISIVNMIKNFIVDLSALNEAGVFFLPLEFQDEYLGGIFISATSSSPNSFLIFYGFTESIQGYSISPSKCGIIPNVEFERISIETVIDRVEFINQLNHFIKSATNFLT